MTVPKECPQCWAPLLVVSGEWGCESCGTHSEGLERLRLHSPTALDFVEGLHNLNSPEEDGMAWTLVKYNTIARLERFRKQFLVPQSAIAIKPDVPQAVDSKTEMGATVARKLANVPGNRLMSFEEAAHAVDKSVSTVRRWCDEGIRLKKHRGRVLTESVKRYLDNVPSD